MMESCKSSILRSRNFVDAFIDIKYPQATLSLSETFRRLQADDRRGLLAVLYVEVYISPVADTLPLLPFRK